MNRFHQKIKKILLPKEVITVEKKETRTDEELKQIALDLLHRKIYSTQHQRLINNPEEIPLVFMPLVFFKPKDLKEFWKQKPAMIFEYIDKASPRSINGLPRFFSMQWLDENEAKKVLDYFHKLKEAEKAVLEK